MVTDAQIQSEIRARQAAGHLPKSDPNTVYFVFAPPRVVITDSHGKRSGVDFVSYHDYDFANDGFAYAVIAYDSTLQDPRLMTMYASHELSETVTDPEPYAHTVAWYDDNYGEVADIPATLFADNVIGFGDFADKLDAPDGTPYLVQKVWSNQDNAPVAFGAPG